MLIAVVCTTVVLLASGEVVASRRYVSYWHDTVSLMEYALKSTPRTVQLHNNLGIAFLWKGNYDKAIEHYNQILEINPEFPQAYVNLGQALAQQGKNEEAIKRYRMVLEIDPNYTKAKQALEKLLKERTKTLK